MVTMMMVFETRPIAGGRVSTWSMRGLVMDEWGSQLRSASCMVGRSPCRPLRGTIGRLREGRCGAMLAVPMPQSTTLQLPYTPAPRGVEGGGRGSLRAAAL